MSGLEETMSNRELVKEFCEDHFDEFQEWLETMHNIEGTEAERILDELCDETDD